MGDLVLSLIAAAIRLSVPILLAATGEVIVQRSGAINIGVEGILLSGAFAAMAGAHALGTSGFAPWAGLSLALLIGLLWGLVFAYFCVWRGADQIVTGTAINLTALGLTGFLNQQGYADVVRVSGFSPSWRAGLFGGAFLVAILTHLFLRSTHLGLAIRAAGEHPHAVETAGVSVRWLRTGTVAFGGMMAGAAGGYLLLTQVPTFIENMSAGRGFIAIAIVIFGRWSALGVLLGSLFFGAADGLQLWLEAVGVGIPDEFLKMLPYLLTLAVLAGYAGRTQAPAKLGIPYRRESL
ncbi:MAG: ABC transporter permease [Candidatus Poribacteria bacterium]|nr:MAG: ABC transporter permease [Candidatus Poribacteria bacterium]